MKRVTGIGGIFFKAKNPEKLSAWYVKHLGLERKRPAPVLFRWREEGPRGRAGHTVWAPFPRDTAYFEASFMLNYRVANLDRLLRSLKREGVRIVPQREESRFGRFAWIMDPEGNRIELWEPPSVKRRRRSAKPRKAQKPGKGSLRAAG